MNAAAKLGLYGLGLVAIFAASFFIAGAIVPGGVQPQPVVTPHNTTEHMGIGPTTDSAWGSSS